MTENEQIIVYDTMISIQERAPILIALLNERSTPAESEAYRTGIYAAVVRLGTLFSAAEHEFHQARRRKIKEDCAAFFAGRAAEGIANANGPATNLQP